MSKDYGKCKHCDGKIHNGNYVYRTVSFCSKFCASSWSSQKGNNISESHGVCEFCGSELNKFHVDTGTHKFCGAMCKDSYRENRDGISN